MNHGRRRRRRWPNLPLMSILAQFRAVSRKRLILSALAIIPVFHLLYSAVERSWGNNYDFAVLLVSYPQQHDDFQMELDLIDYIITNEFPEVVGPKLTKYDLLGRRHTPQTPCTPIHLRSGKFSIQHAPDLFCTPAELARMLLNGWNGNSWFADRGVKIVHLVQNPFTMAVSNYQRNVISPEDWMKVQHPCDIQYADRKLKKSFRDRVLPTLTTTTLPSDEQLLTVQEFDDIRTDCLSLYRTHYDLNGANFLDHLVYYDAPEGLRLATAQTMIQGDKHGGDILRMANNIVKFNEAQNSVMKSLDYQKKGKEFHVNTMSMDDFIAQPAASAVKFFDFVLGQSVSGEDKAAAAREYERRYLEEKKSSKRITHGSKSGNMDQLKEYLRRDTAFGHPLSKIELLVNRTITQR